MKCHAGVTWCEKLFYGRRGQVCCSARCRARASRDRRTARLLAALGAVADYLPTVAQDAYDELMEALFKPGPGLARRAP